MPVSAIFENLEAGANIDGLMEWFDGLDREQVKEVVHFKYSAESATQPAPCICTNSGASAPACPPGAIVLVCGARQ